MELTHAERRVVDHGVLTTKERILREASVLFARKGYRATTTREIAQAVDVRQPSLFHHFGSKAEIMKQLLTHSLTEPSLFAERLAAAPGDATDRLYELVLFDTLYLMMSPYYLSGLSDDDVMEDPEFRTWYVQRDRMRRARQMMVVQGIRSGEFLDVGAEFATNVLIGVVLSTVSSYSGRMLPNTIELSRRIAAFALRGLLMKTDALDEVSARVLPPDASEAEVDAALTARIPSAAEGVRLRGLLR